MKRFRRQWYGMCVETPKEGIAKNQVAQNCRFQSLRMIPCKYRNLIQKGGWRGKRKGGLLCEDEEKAGNVSLEGRNRKRFGQCSIEVRNDVVPLGL